MNEQEILSRITPLLADLFSLEPEEVTSDMTFDELGADELDLQELAWMLEEEFDLPDGLEEKLYALSGVGELCRLVSRHLS